MGGARGRPQGNRKEAPLSVQVEIVVVHDPEVRRRQVKGIRSFLHSVAARVGDPATSDGGVGAEKARDDGLEGLMGPLEAEVVRVVWPAKAPVSLRVGAAGAERGPAQTPWIHDRPDGDDALARKPFLARSRQGRADLYRAVASDAASLAVSRLLAQFGEAAIRPFVEQVAREPDLRLALRTALPLHE
jgi:hypothetical protein